MKLNHSLLLTALLLVSCGETETNASIPLFHYENIHVTIDSKEDTMLCRLFPHDFNTLKNNKASFPLYVFAAGCGACDAFGLTLKDYVSQNSLFFPMMILSDYLQTDKALNLTDSSLMFIQDGKVIQYRSTFTDIGSSKDLSKYISGYTYDTKATLINSCILNTNYTTTFNTYFLNSYIGMNPDFQEEQYREYSVCFDTESVEANKNYYLLDETSCWENYSEFQVQESPSYIAFCHKEMNNNPENIRSLFSLDSTSNFTVFNKIEIDGNKASKLINLNYE